MEDLSDFEGYLRSQTGIGEGSIRVYVQAVSALLDRFSSPSVEEMNVFISDKAKVGSCVYIKYAIAHYLRFLKRGDEIKMLIRIKVKARKRFGVYADNGVILGIIEGIRSDKYRAVALIQFATGRRAREILTLREENVLKEGSTIKLRMVRKGGGECVAWLNLEKYAPVLKPFLKGERGLIFMRREFSDVSPKMFERKVANERTYYFKALKESARRAGLREFGTHDLRRNFAERIKVLSGGDIQAVRDSLGHADISTTMRYFERGAAAVKGVMLEHQEGV